MYENRNGTAISTRGAVTTMMDLEEGAEHEAGKLLTSFGGIERIVNAEGELTRVLRIDEARASDSGLPDLGMVVGAPVHPDASRCVLATVQGRWAIQDPRSNLQYCCVMVQAQMALQ